MKTPSREWVREKAKLEDGCSITAMNPEMYEQVFGKVIHKIFVSVIYDDGKIKQPLTMLSINHLIPHKLSDLLDWYAKHYDFERQYLTGYISTSMIEIPQNWHENVSSN